ncbi:MAG TPA: SPOR domain-containing protein [Burkholderiaceae bacterium]|nr:SPOR domain-containing protein [Burkholderiaceae bacterium]
MKLVFLLLLLANVALLAWQHGVFGRYAEPGREPERIARQIEPERIRVLSEKDVQMLRERASQAKAAATAAAAPAQPDLSLPQACVEFGDFLGADVGRVETALLGLGLGSRQTSRTVEVPGLYMVYVPPYKTRAEADRAAADLVRRGIKDVVVLTDGPQRFGLSLGLFRDPELAKSHLAAVDKQGVKSARLSDKPTSLSGTRYQLRELDAAAARQLAEIRKEFPAQSIRPCSTG